MFLEAKVYYYSLRDRTRIQGIHLNNSAMRNSSGEDVVWCVLKSFANNVFCEND